MQPVLESKFTYKGYPCVVLFMPGMYRCGYVGIPITHKLAEKSIDDLMDIDCHGGITYSEHSLYGCDDKTTWWIGFDCGHCFDGYDIEAAKRYFANDKDWNRIYGVDFVINSYKTLNAAEGIIIRSEKYVKDECKKIVDQIIKE